MPSKVQSIPTPALVLGIAGLIPFFLCAAVACLSVQGSELLESFRFSSGRSTLSGDELKAKAIAALGAYGAIILSFLGGIRWGNVLNNKTLIRQWTPLLFSVVPSLIAWPALLLPATWTLSVLAAGFVMQYAYDVESIRKKELPAWFGRLRTILTTGAIVALLTGLLAITL